MPIERQRSSALTVAVAVAVVWLALIPLMVPSTGSDRGIFVSVAHRMLAGDRLYAGVYDNKEPLFYYFVLLQRNLGGISEFVFEVLQFVACSVAAYLLLDGRAAGPMRVLTAFGAAPVIMAGAYYIPGGTHLPGATLTLIAFCVAIRGHAFSSGLLVGATAFVKILYFPVAFPIAAWLAFAAGTRPRRMIAGVAISTLVICGFLAWRGELLPFIDIVSGNVRYSGNDVILQTSAPLARLFAHLTRVDAVPLIAVVGMVLSCSAIAIAWSGVFPAAGGRIPGCMTIIPIVAVVVSIGVLALTAMWHFHFQLLYLAGILGVIAVTPVLCPLYGRSRGAGLLVLLYCAVVLSAGYRPAHVVRAWLAFPAALGALVTVSPEATALSSLGASGRYARLGGTDDARHAWTTEAWTLQCPRFHQYYFEPRDILERVLECARTADHLLIGRTLVKNATDPEAWTDFVDRVEDLLAREYDCQVVREVRACRRRKVAS